MSGRNDSIDVVASLDVAPGNITLGIDGRIFLGLHQFHNPDVKACELVDGELKPFPCGARL